MAETTVGELRTSANAVLAGLELQDVFLARTQHESKLREETHATLNAGFGVQTKFGLRPDGTLDVWVKYLVFALPSDEAEETSESDDDPELSDEEIFERAVWFIESEWVAQFAGDFEALEAHSNADLNSFSIVMGPPIVHPYARDLVQSLTGRSEHAAFTLGLLTPVTAMPDDAVIDVGDIDEALTEGSE